MIGNRPALAVTVSVAGVPLGTAAVGCVERPDVAASLGIEEAARSGWSMEVDLASVGGDQLDLEITVWQSLGTEPRRLAPIPVRTEPGSRRGQPTRLGQSMLAQFDEPSDGDLIVGDVLEVSGWCLFEGTHVARVEVVVDGKPVGLARPYVARPDVAKVHQHVDAPLAGFEAMYSFERFERPVSSLVAVQATSLDGRRWVSPTRSVRWAPGTVADRDDDLDHPRRSLLDGIGGGGSRVLVVTHTLSYGGGQLWLLELLRQIVQHSALDVVVVSMGNGPLREVLEGLGCAVHVTAPSTVDDAVAYEDKVEELALLFRSCGAGVVLANTLGVFAGVHAAERAGIPVVWAIHESFDPACYQRICWGPTGMDPRVRASFEGCLRYARALVFEARQTAELFTHLCASSQCFVVDYGVDVDEIDAYRESVDRAALRRAAGFADDDVVLLVVGVIEPRKAQGAIVTAFDELARAHDNLRLAMVGSWTTPYDEAIRARVEGSAAAGRIDLWPITPDVYPWYAAADVLVCASDIESLPRSILEAMAFGLPTASTDVFGISDLITDGRTGWLTRDRDLEGLIGMLDRVVRLPAEERRAVGARARAEVRARHGEHSYGRLFARALRALVEDPDSDLSPLLGGQGGGRSRFAAAQDGARSRA